MQGEIKEGSRVSQRNPTRPPSKRDTTHRLSESQGGSPRVDGVAPQVLNRRQAATYLGISTATLDRLALDGRLNPVRISPRIVRYRVTDLDAYLASLVPELTR